MHQLSVLSRGPPDSAVRVSSKEHFSFFQLTNSIVSVHSRQLFLEQKLKNPLYASWLATKWGIKSETADFMSRRHYMTAALRGQWNEVWEGEANFKKQKTKAPTSSFINGVYSIVMSSCRRWCLPVWLIVCLCEALQRNLWMVQTHVLVWCEQHLHHDVGRCVTERSFAIQEMGTLHLFSAESGTSSVTCCMHGLLLFLLLLLFFLLRRCTSCASHLLQSAQKL